MITNMLSNINYYYFQNIILLSLYIKANGIRETFFLWSEAAMMYGQSFPSPAYVCRCTLRLRKWGKNAEKHTFHSATLHRFPTAIILNQSWSKLTEAAGPVPSAFRDSGGFLL